MIDILYVVLLPGIHHFLFYLFFFFCLRLLVAVRHKVLIIINKKNVIHLHSSDSVLGSDSP